MRILAYIFLICCSTVFGQFINNTADFSVPTEYEIGPVRVVGADNFDQQAIKAVAGLRQGQKITIPGDQLSKAIRNLWEEELFSDISIVLDKEIQGVVYLSIHLKARPKLSHFKFRGIPKREADKLREELDLFSGKTITENLLFQTDAKIRGYFREKGFYSVSADITRIKDTIMNDSEIFVINIERGEKVGIKEIQLDGAESVATWKLYMAMKDTKKKSILRIFKRSKYTVSTYEKDKKALIEKFYAAGLRDAHIVSDTVYFQDPKNLIIRITINEGSKYYFGDFEWYGNSKYRSSFLDSVIGIKKGDVYNKTLLDKRLNGGEDGRDINSLYMNKGHLFFQIYTVETGVTGNFINYQFRIYEGKEARYGEITVIGNTKTNDQVIYREIRTKPGDLFNKEDIMRTQRELSQLGFFNDQTMKVNPMPNPEKGTVDIQYVVEEKSSDQIELSGGYGGAGPTGSGRVIGTLGLTFNNFSTKNFFKKSAWSPLPGGDGQRLSIRAQSNGRFYQGYTFSFTEPWLGGKKPNALSFWLNNTALSSNGFIRTNPAYNGISITGVGVGLQRRKKFPDDYFTAYYELSYQYYDVVNDFRFPLFPKGYSNDIALKYVLQRSSVSAPIYPQSGSNFTFTAKSSLPYSYFQKGLDYSTMSIAEKYLYLEYFKFKFTGEWYLPLTANRKLVLMPRFGFGYIGAYTAAKGVTPFDRFTMGGSGLTGVNQLGGREIIALRGYEDQAISSGGSDPIIAKYTLELRYPISLNPQATFYVTGFLEAGNTFPDLKNFNPFNVKRAAGVGIRVFLPMFGMLGLDYGLGFDKLDSWGSGYNGPSDASITTKGFYPKLSFTIGMNLGEL
jgi:outer membrane protein insertion porin family